MYLKDLQSPTVELQQRKHQLLERGYSKQIIYSQMGKVKFGQRLKVGYKQAGTGVPFVITCHPKLKKMKYLPRTPIVSG